MLMEDSSGRSSSDTSTSRRAACNSVCWRQLSMAAAAACAGVQSIRWHGSELLRCVCTHVGAWPEPCVCSQQRHVRACSPGNTTAFGFVDMLSNILCSSLLLMWLGHHHSSSPDSSRCTSGGCVVASSAVRDASSCP